MARPPTPKSRVQKPVVHRPGGRSAVVVARLLQAASAELVEHGYVALSLERVAERASVNKSTIYRRWPTKKELVVALVRSLGEPALEAPQTGNIREDLLSLAGSMRKRLLEYHRRGLAKVIAAEHEDSEVAKVALAVRTLMREPWYASVRGAITTHRLRPDMDVELFVEVVVSAITFRVIKRDKGLDDHFLRSLIDLTLLGAKPR